jgi:DNA relaxase NicK
MIHFHDWQVVDVTSDWSGMEAYGEFYLNVFKVAQICSKCKDKRKLFYEMKIMRNGEMKVDKHVILNDIKIP